MIVVLGSKFSTFVYAEDLVCPLGFSDGIKNGAKDLDFLHLDDKNKDSLDRCPMYDERREKSYIFRPGESGEYPIDVNKPFDPKKKEEPIKSGVRFNYGNECCKDFGRSANNKKHIIVIIPKVEKGKDQDWTNFKCPSDEYSDEASRCDGVDVLTTCCKPTQVVPGYAGGPPVTFFDYAKKINKISPVSEKLCCKPNYFADGDHCGNRPNGFFDNYCCKKYPDSWGSYIYEEKQKISCPAKLESTDKCCPKGYFDTQAACGGKNGQFLIDNCCYNGNSKEKISCTDPNADASNTSNQKGSSLDTLTMQLSENKKNVFCDIGDDPSPIPETGNIRVYTAFGCVPATVETFIKWLLPYLFGIAGGISFLLMVFGFIKVATSAGDPKEIEGAKETITSALIGLLVSIFALFILKLILADILKIPGIS